MWEFCEGQMEGMATNTTVLGTSQHARFPRSYLLYISDAATKGLLSLPSCSYQWELHTGWHYFSGEMALIKALIFLLISPKTINKEIHQQQWRENGM